MKIAIHQPQYFPWLPYFSKINRADVFVFLDDVQYQKNGLQNRNQLKNSNGKFWLTIPISSNHNTKIKDVSIIKNNWNKKHIKSIETNYKRAKNFSFFSNNLKPVLLNHSLNLSELNSNLIKIICSKFFNINKSFYFQSELSVSGKGSDLILDICKKIGATEYISGPGAIEYLNEKSFHENNISVNYIKNKLPDSYPQLYSKNGFMNNLSALDFILLTGDSWKDYYSL
tara:strand:+ start:112 stop:795 length:684 start_codon:yes stop_codon:yes gene_type:complete